VGQVCNLPKFARQVANLPHAPEERIMHPNAWLKCVAVLLLALGAQRTLSASARSEARKPDSKPVWVVEGVGTTSDAALENALDSALTKVNEYLDEQRPAIEWRPTREYVRDNLVRSLKDGDPALKDASQDQDWKDRTSVTVPGQKATGLCDQRKVGEEGNTRTVYRVLLRAEVAPRDLDEIKKFELKHQQELRDERARVRQMVLVRLLAGIVAILIAVASYLRLEDATKGYYTTLLRVVAVAFVAAVVAGLALIGT
jgi:hypothetical protein